ncbi:MAG: hypothetical protein PWQ84_535 [Thermotogaceae bacterium]|nr:hypothetical protein [Thermotogaceae bacterium]
MEKKTELLYDTFKKLPSSIKEKANIYYNIGRILNYSTHVETGRIKIQALIRGTEDYFTEIELSNKNSDFYCTCPYFRGGNICKHIGALIIKALEDKEHLINEYRSTNRLNLLKRKHKEYKTKSGIKNFIQELESKKSTQLLDMLNEYEAKALVLELHKTANEIEVIVYGQRLGAKGTPVKTGRRELTLAELTSFYDPRFSEFLTFIKYSHDHFSIKDFHKFKNVFSGYPYIFLEHKKRKIEFGPELSLILKKKNNQIKLAFINEKEEITIDGDTIIESSNYNYGKYIPVYGESNQTGLLVNDTIFPVISPLNHTQIRHLYNGKANLETVLFSRKEMQKEVIKKNVIAPLITMGVNFDNELNVHIPLQVQNAEKKAVWIIERMGDVFLLKLEFSYSGIRIKPDEQKNEIVDSKSSNMYIRDYEFEEEQMEILRNNLSMVKEENNAYSWELSLEDVLKIIDELFVQHSDTVILDCDKKLTKIQHPKTVVNVDVKSGIDWFEMNFNITADEKELPFDRVLQTARENNEFIEIDGQFYRLDKRELNKLKKLSGKIKNLKKDLKEGWHRFDILQEIDEYESTKLDEKVTNILRMTEDFSGIKEYMIPKSFNGKLRDYQISGYNWLRFLEEFHLNGVLADDMGLGKTVQTICLLLSFFERNFELNGIIICPKSLLKNWKKEIERFAPLLKSEIYHGTKNERKEIREKNCHIWITTYGTFRNDSVFFNKEVFDYCIVDEAQNLKNNQTKTFIEMKKLTARHKIALTGTPIENSISDLKSLFDFLIPGFFGSNKEYKRNYEHDYKSLQKKIKPLMLRRKKEEVLKDLPPKTIKNFYVDMTERQEELYINYYMRVKNEVKEMTQTQEEWNTNRFQILKHILRLRQIATHPEMFIKDEKIGSGKLDSLIELLEEITSEGHKTIVFSQFSTMLEIVRKELNIREMNGLIIDGSTRNREQILNKFKEEEEQRILLMTLKVGGVGLNLTEADYVIILDPWWNPAVEMQAIDRTHRIGQTMPVMVYRMISSSTIEEKVLELQRKKMAIMNDVVEGTTDMEKQISAEDIREMFD